MEPLERRQAESPRTPFATSASKKSQTAKIIIKIMKHFSIVTNYLLIERELPPPVRLLE